MVRFILGIIIGLVSLVFIVQNPEVVKITFLAWSISLPQAVLFLALVVFGVIMGWIFRSIGLRKRRIKSTKKG